MSGLALVLLLSLVAQADEPERLPVEQGRTPVELPKLDVDKPKAAPVDPRAASDVRGFEVGEDGVLVITVTGRQEMTYARDQVVRGIKAEGWTVADREGDVWEFRGPERWMGRLFLDPEGTITFKRNLVLFDGGAAKSTADYATFSGVERDAGLVTVIGEGAIADGYADPSKAGRAQTVIVPEVRFTVPAGKRKLDRVHMDLLNAIGSDLAWYRAVRQETLHEEHVDQLPARLDRLWADGTPLLGGAVITSPADRRTAVLEYWANLPDDPHGLRSAEVTAAWIVGTLDGTPHALTDEELATWQARRPSGPPIDPR